MVWPYHSFDCVSYMIKGKRTKYVLGSCAIGGRSRRVRREEEGRRKNEEGGRRKEAGGRMVEIG